MPRQPLGQRINAWLQEPEGAQFTDGKWKFWFIAVAFLSVVNSILTALIFRGDEENHSGAIVLSVGALVAWLCIGALHYSDSTDRRLARGVSALDSIALIFVVVHFSGLLWIYGHHRTLVRAEQKYEAAAEKYNADARQIQDGNVRIAESAERIAQAHERAEKLKNDAAYQLRKAAESGARIVVPRSAPESGIAPGLTTSQIQLEAPTRPTQSSAAYLGRWDWAIRLANCGELLIACLIMILIRNVSARSNTPTSAPVAPSYVSARTPAPAAPLRQPQTQTHVSFPAPVSSAQGQTPAQTHVSSTFNREGLRLLRESLKDISFGLRGISFKADVKPQEGCVWIRAMQAVSGTQQTLYSTRATLEILDDATTMPRDAYRERLERFLKQNGFTI